MEEYFDIVDENNIPTGEKRLRSESHTIGLWHKVVHIYFFKKLDAEIEFLVHLRSKTKDTSPNRWDTRFGGHLKSGETVEDTLKDEMMEEVGVELEPGNLIHGEVYKKDEFPNREFVSVFYYKFEKDISNLKFNDGEVQEIKWMKVSDIAKSMTENPETWSGDKEGLLEVLEVLKNKI